MRPSEGKKQLPDVPPHQVTAYLTATNWVSEGLVGKYAEVWHRPVREDRADAEVVVPQVPTLRDFRQRMHDALEAIAEFELRAFDDVLRAIEGHRADQISVRVFHHDVEQGTIPLEDGVLLNERARDLMVASALSTIVKRRHFTGSRPPEAKEYIDSLRLGQTEIGSYIVNVIVPIQPVHSEQVALDATPFASVVTETLTSSLVALDSALERYTAGESLSVFDSAVSVGASANMCEALKGLSGVAQTRGFEITVTPSPSVGSLPLPKTFVFSGEKLSAIGTASEYYRENYILLDRKITGFVKRLDRPPDQEEGTVQIVSTLPDGSERNVAVELGSDHYKEAYDAHGAGELVECSGDLHVNSRAARLLNAVGFRVLRNGELF